MPKATAGRFRIPGKIDKWTNEEIIEIKISIQLLYLVASKLMLDVQCWNIGDFDSLFKHVIHT